MNEVSVPLATLTRRATSTLGTDGLGRPLRDLRISVTDRCNFRCTYCMPREAFGADHPFLPRSAMLSFEEIHRLAAVLVGMGVRKIRITGGEPLLRRDLDRLVSMLAGLGAELTLTTNGALLERHARALKAAGLQRLTVSLDALDDATFRRMNDVDFPVAEVLAGIDAAASAGFSGIKVNAVIRRGVNDAEVLPLARHFRGSGHVLRFIEYMDVGGTAQWRMDEVLPARELLARIDAEFPLAPLEAGYHGEVAERWHYLDGQGEIGVIASVTQPFCRDCTRMRLSPEGKLFTCLFASHGHDMRDMLRSGANDQAVAARIAGIWNARTDRYSELRGVGFMAEEKINMSYIGG